MNFTVSTKPFADALNLGVINANISKFYQKSLLAQLTADAHMLTINLEAASIATEIKLKGSGDAEETKIIFVDCAALKSIVGTFEASVTTLEFTENGLILHSGSSKFTLPKMVDSDKAELAKPALAQDGQPSIKLDKNDWKFIDDHQMYAIGTSFTYPVYTKVWAGEKGDIIVGDFAQSIFTYSKKNKLGRTCLLSSTIINFMISLPDGATITSLGNSYRVDVKCDAFEYAAEFTPNYETDPGVGDYKSEDMFAAADRKDENNVIKIAVEPIKKIMSQSSILASSGDHITHIKFADSELCISDANVDCKMKVEGTCCNFEADFETELFRTSINNVDAEAIKIYPLMEGTETDGIEICTEAMSIVLGASTNGVQTA